MAADNISRLIAVRFIKFEKKNNMNNQPPKGNIFSGLYNVKETADSFSAKKKWKNFWIYLLPLFVGGILAFYWLRVGVIWPGLLALLVFYIGLCGVFNSYKITITPERIVVKQGFLPILFIGINKPFNDLQTVSVDAEFHKTSRKMYNQKAGFHYEQKKRGYNLIGDFKGRRLNILSFRTVEIEHAKYVQHKINQIMGYLGSNSPSV